MPFSYSMQNTLIDFLFRGRPYTPPSTLYCALIIASRGYSSNIRNTAINVGDTVIPTTPNGRLYKCVAAGTSGATDPTWSTVANGVTVDGTVTWQEQSTNIQNDIFSEPSGASYARASITSSLTNWAGTQGAGTTVASAGTTGQTSNNVAITFPTPGENWGVIYGVALMTTLTGGTIITWSYLSNPKTINAFDSAPSFAIGTLPFVFNNPT